METDRGPARTSRRPAAWALRIIALLIIAGLSAVVLAQQSQIERLEAGATKPSGGAVADEGDFDVDAAGIPADLAVAEDVLSLERDFADDVDLLNEVLALPHDIVVTFGLLEDDPAPAGGPYYDPETGGIYFPYEFIAEIADALTEALGYEDRDELLATVRASVEHITYHEIGHALVHQLELPVTGREEDVVDGLATLLMVRTYEGTGGQEAALAASDTFDAFGRLRGEDIDFESLADEHSLDEQRSVQTVCFVIGSAPEEFGHLVDDGFITAERAELCEEEWAQLESSWDKLLEGYWKD